MDYSVVLSVLDDHISKEQFLLEFFGNFGRELADPTQRFTDNPTDIFPFIEECAREKKPAFISVQPRRAANDVIGIEKLFFDFDYLKKSENLTNRQIEARKRCLEREVRKFVFNLTKAKVKALVLKTRRGYHFHIFFDSVYLIDNDIDYWKFVYKELQRKFMGRRKWVTLDSSIIGDIMRMCRIPFSIHEKSGEVIQLLDMNLKPDKIRGLDYYRLAGLTAENLRYAMKVTDGKLENKAKVQHQIQQMRKEHWETVHGFTGSIRPCFSIRMDAGEMGHDQRRALLVEAYYAGYNTEAKMVELFRCFHDFDGDKSNSKCRYQVHYWFERPKPKPYTCETLQEHGWCLKERCPIYQRRMEKLKNGK